MYYPRKIPEHFLKNITRTEDSIPLTAREQVRQPPNLVPLAMVLLLEFLNTKKDG